MFFFFFYDFTMSEKNGKISDMIFNDFVMGEFMIF